MVPESRLEATEDAIALTSIPQVRGHTAVTYDTDGPGFTSTTFVDQTPVPVRKSSVTDYPDAIWSMNCFMSK
jgi:hypothetical protein